VAGFRARPRPCRGAGGSTARHDKRAASVVDQVRLSHALAAVVADGGRDAAMAVCQARVAWLPMTGASITIMDDAEVQEPVCATDPGAARIDELQFTLGDGPCVESFRTGRTVLVSDITDITETRWPMFATAAADTGAGACLCSRCTSGPPNSACWTATATPPAP
jgi:hypothetical protein